MHCSVPELNAVDFSLFSLPRDYFTGIHVWNYFHGWKKMPKSDADLPELENDRGSAAPGAERTLAILELLSQAGNAGLTISEIAKALALPQNSTSRIVETIQ